MTDVYLQRSYVYLSRTGCDFDNPLVLFFFVTDARTGTLESAKAMSRTSKLSTLEAMQILNLQKGEMKPDLIKKVRDTTPDATVRTTVISYRY